MYVCMHIIYAQRARSELLLHSKGGHCVALKFLEIELESGYHVRGEPAQEVFFQRRSFHLSQNKNSSRRANFFK
jgi:hypothetical protein